MMSLIMSALIGLGVYGTNLDERCVANVQGDMSWSEGMACVERLASSPSRAKSEVACLYAEKLHDLDSERAINELPESIDYCF